MPLSSSQNGGRVGGLADYPVAVDQVYPPGNTPPGGLVVGVVDTGYPGVGGAHPWLSDHIEYSDADAEPALEGTMLDRYSGHGTFVSGLIIREAPAATVRMARPKHWDDDVAVGVTIASLRGCTLVNLSFFGADRELDPPAPIVEALRQLGPGAVVVVCAGNNRSATRAYPAGIDFGADGPMIISVGAVDETRTVPVGAPPPIADFSNFGQWVDVYASGVQVLGPHVSFQETEGPSATRVPQHFAGWALWSGTSFAAATVTGRIARVATDRSVSAREAAQLVLAEAERIPVPNEIRDIQPPYWMPFVRAAASTWGEITLKSPTG